MFRKDPEKMKPAKAIFEAYLPQIEAALKEILPKAKAEDERSRVLEAMRYAVLDGGKRIRPLLLLEFCRICGGDMQKAMPFACAVELIHSYSLVHDDLPCMDNDALRRGKPSVHKAFGEATALLAGDALLTYAFQIMLVAENAIPGAWEAAACLAKEAGCWGMIGGQMIDLDSEGKTGSLALLKKMDEGKTVALIRAACRMGCLLAGCPERLDVADVYAENVGLAFQIQDDILDLEGDSALLGKATGSDVQNQKTTYVSVLGIEEAKKMVAELTENAVEAIKAFGESGSDLADLACFLGTRRK